MKTLAEKISQRAVVLSPMAGFSDSPYRALCRQLGSAFSITEFVSTDMIFRGSPKAIRLFRYDEIERPIVFQVFGNNPLVILQACKKLLPLKPDGFDLNMGCSVRNISHKGSGAGLMREPQKVKEIISSMVKELGLPISAKIRLGWNHDSLNYLEICKIIEGEGAWSVTIHGRTKSMGYKGNADWSPIGEIKNKVSIKVFGNGDVKSYHEAKEKIKTYNLDGVYVGRNAIGNPWIFAGRSIKDMSLAERYDVIVSHLQQFCKFYADDGYNPVVLFRKHLVKYLRYLEIDKTIHRAMLKIEEQEELITFLSLLRNQFELVG